MEFLWFMLTTRTSISPQSFDVKPIILCDVSNATKKGGNQKSETKLCAYHDLNGLIKSSQEKGVITPQNIALLQNYYMLHEPTGAHFVKSFSFVG
jgi:hypothetical protein